MNTKENTYPLRPTPTGMFRGSQDLEIYANLWAKCWFFSIFFRNSDCLNGHNKSNQIAKIINLIEKWNTEKCGQIYFWNKEIGSAVPMLFHFFILVKKSGSNKANVIAWELLIWFLCSERRPSTIFCFPSSQIFWLF